MQTKTQTQTAKMVAGIRSILIQGADPMKYAGSLAEACGVSRAEVVAAIAEMGGAPREVSAAQVADERLAEDRRSSSAARRHFDHEEN